MKLFGNYVKIGKTTARKYKLLRVTKEHMCKFKNIRGHA